MSAPHEAGPATPEAWCDVSFCDTDGSLADAVRTAGARTRFHLAPGIYRGPLVALVDVEIVAASGLGTVTIEASRGVAISAEGADQIVLKDLILKGPRTGFGHVIIAYNPCDWRLEGCVVTGGRGEGQGGGGIDVQQGRVVLQRCRISQNAGLQGGGVRVAGAALVDASDCLFVDNSAEGIGGGAAFANRGGTLVLRRCTFTGNRGKHGSALLAGRGGFGGRINATNCLFAKEQVGLVVAVHGEGQLTLRHSVIAKLAEMVSEGVVVGDGVVEREVPLRLEAPRYGPLFTAQLRGLGTSDEDSIDTDLYKRERGSVLVGAVA